MRRVLLPFVLALSIVAGCDDLALQPDPSSKSSAPDQRPSATVVLPAGSVDGLAGAIAAAGPNGTVVVAAGLHTESAGIEITSPVRIQGDPGAVLEFALDPVPVGGATELDPDLHIKDTHGVRIEGLTFRAAAGRLPNTAVLVDESPQVRVTGNTIEGHQYGVLVLESDQARVSGNTISCSTAWQTGAIGEAFGIVVISGSHAQINDNEVSGGLFGIWCCDRRGVAIGNVTHDCFVGLILCTVPWGGFLVDGTAYGANFSCASWTIERNNCSNNLHVGLLVIDNANNNRLVRNTGSGNALYDIEFTGDSFRFGFLTPSSHDNHAVLGDQPALRVKDCGANNTLIGTVDLIDNTSDPCF